MTAPLTEAEIDAALALDPASHDDAELIVKLWPRLAAELRRAREALRMAENALQLYACHEDECAAADGRSRECNCGKTAMCEAVIAALEEPSDV